MSDVCRKTSLVKPKRFSKLPDRMRTKTGKRLLKTIRITASSKCGIQNQRVRLWVVPKSESKINFLANCCQQSQLWMTYSWEPVFECSTKFCPPAHWPAPNRCHRLLILDTSPGYSGLHRTCGLKLDPAAIFIRLWRTCPPLVDWTNPPQADLRWLLVNSELLEKLKRRRLNYFMLRIMSNEVEIWTENHTLWQFYWFHQASQLW